GKGSVWEALKNFYVRRAFRLFPVCWLWIGLYAIFSQFDRFGNLLKAPGAEVLAILTYTYNFLLISNRGRGVLFWHWSLSIEEQFYLLFPLFLIIMKKDKVRMIWLSFYVLAITFFVRPFLMGPGTWDWPDFRTTSYLKFDSIALGCLIYFAFRNKKSPPA